MLLLTWTLILAPIAFCFGGVRRALRNHQGPRITLDICLGAPVLWSALRVHGATCAIALAAGIMGYIWVARGRELPGLELSEFDPTYGENEPPKRQKDESARSPFPPLRLAASRQADIRCTITHRTAHSEQLILRNVGAAAAYDVTILATEPELPYVQGDRDEKLPVPKLEPGDEQWLIARVLDGRSPGG